MTAGAKLRRLAALNARQWGVLIRTQWLLPRIRMHLRRTGLKSTQRWIARQHRRGGSSPPAVSAGEIHAIASAVNASSRYGLFRGACLQRSLVLSYVLHRCGVEHQLVIGADLDEEGFNAHAWVECEGHVVNDAPDVRQRFGVFEIRDTGQGTRDTGLGTRT